MFSELEGCFFVYLSHWRAFMAASDDELAASDHEILVDFGLRISFHYCYHFTVIRGLGS